MAGVAEFTAGRKSSIGTTAVQITTSTIHAHRGVQVVAAAGNSVTVYVGTSTVTTDSADGTDGFPLAAGESVVIPIIDPSKIYVRAASGTTSKVFFITV